METKKRIILLIVLVSLLSGMFFIQKNLVISFATKPERLELSFESKDEILSYLLEEKEYISELYNISNEYGMSYQENIVSIISIEKPINSGDEFFKEKFIDYLRLRNPDLNEELLNVTDYSHANTIIMEWHRASKFFIASILFILIVVIFIRRIQSLNKYLKYELKMYYLKEVIQLRTIEILEESIKLVLLLFVGLFLLQWIIKFQFNIPGKYLPVSNIFDFEFYRMTQKMKLTFSNYGNIYNSILFKVKLLTLGNIIISIFIFLFLVNLENVKVKKGRDTYGKSGI